MQGSEYRPIVRRQLLGHGSCLDISRHVIKARRPGRVTQVDFFQFSRTIMPPYRRPTKRGIGDYCAGYQVFACMYVLYTLEKWNKIEQLYDREIKIMTVIQRECKIPNSTLKLRVRVIETTIKSHGALLRAGRGSVEYNNRFRHNNIIAVESIVISRLSASAGNCRLSSRVRDFACIFSL